MAKRASPARAKSAEAPDEPPVPFDQDGLKRVSAIIQNARATWFALLGALVFASVTLASVKDISFFVNTVETKLPVVGISVPVNSFFWAGSLLIAAVYAYFHLYLELLWQALGDAPSRIQGKPLADRIEPWIVADAALRLRDHWRKSHGDSRCSRRRAMPLISGTVSIGLVWIFGLLVIGWFWWRSMPAHDPGLTGFTGLVFAATIWVFGKTAFSAFAHLADRELAFASRGWFAVVIALVFGFTVVRSGLDPWAEQPRETVIWPLICEGSPRAGTQNDSWPCFSHKFSFRLDFMRPARARMSEVVFTEKPKDWQGKEIAETEFRVRWCKERGDPKCANPLDPARRKFEGEAEKEFQTAWKERWTALLTTFPKPDLRRADLRGAVLRGASMEGADLTGASMEGAVLTNARMEGADLSFARMEGAVLSFARMEGADLRFARMEGADLSDASMEGADLRFASMEGADLRFARMEGAVLSGASMAGADLSDARLFGSTTKQLDLASAYLGAANFAASALRDAEVSAKNITDAKNFSSSFGDASVRLPEGTARPCHWGKTRLADAEYFGRWEGWAELIGPAPVEFAFDEFPPLYPDPECIPRLRPQ